MHPGVLGPLLLTSEENFTHHAWRAFAARLGASCIVNPSRGVQESQVPKERRTMSDTLQSHGHDSEQGAWSWHWGGPALPGVPGLNAVVLNAAGCHIWKGTLTETLTKISPGCLCKDFLNPASSN